MIQHESQTPIIATGHHGAGLQLASVDMAAQVFTHLEIISFINWWTARLEACTEPCN